MLYPARPSSAVPLKLSCRTSAKTTTRLIWPPRDRKSTRLNSSHRCISYAVFFLQKGERAMHNHVGQKVGRRIRLGKCALGTSDQLAPFFFYKATNPGAPIFPPPRQAHDH